MLQRKKSPKTVLIAEDDASIREVLQECLESEGFQTELAENGQIGIDKLESMLPGLVLLDMKMPVMDGREFLNRIQKDPVLKDIPVIVISANATVSEAFGAKAFIPKPIDFQNLIRTISAVCPYEF